MTTQLQSLVDAFLLFAQGEPEISEGRLGAAMRLIGLSVQTWELRTMWHQVQESDPEIAEFHPGIQLPEFISLMIMMMNHLEEAEEKKTSKTTLNPRAVCLRFSCESLNVPFWGAVSPLLIEFMWVSIWLTTG